MFSCTNKYNRTICSCNTKKYKKYIYNFVGNNVTNIYREVPEMILFRYFAQISVLQWKVIYK